MLISYHSVLSILSKGYQVLTLNEFIEAYKDEISSSETTALLIEDYKYLSVIQNKDGTYDGLVIVYSPDRADFPIILEENKSISIYECAKLFCDTGPKLDKASFYKAIEKESVAQTMEPTSHFLQFDMCVDAIMAQRQISSKKVGRNDPCPCGSKKKYKQCHGSVEQQKAE